MRSYIPGQAVILLVSVLTTANLAFAQDNTLYRGPNAVLLQVSENTRNEYMLKGATIGLQNSSGQLTVRLNLPYDSVSHSFANDGATSSRSLLFELKVNIDPKIQSYLTSSKTFETRGALSLNDSTKSVRVDYIPMPAGTSQDGNFNLSMAIQFNPADFNLTDVHTNSNFIIRISNTPVNRR